MTDLIDALMFFGVVTVFTFAFTFGLVLLMALRFHFEDRRQGRRGGDVA